MFLRMFLLYFSFFNFAVIPFGLLEVIVTSEKGGIFSKVCKLVLICHYTSLFEKIECVTL